MSGRTIKLLICIWLLATGTGFYALFDYGSTPGASGTPTSDWPAECRIPLDPRRANLVVAIHPRCPCSQATIDALVHVMTHGQGLATAHVLFFRPADASENWERTDLWHRAAALPGVKTIADEDGREALRFGARTSGHVLLYCARGKLLFSGGITVARGHQGANPGLASLLACLTQGNSGRPPWPVFGCPLQNPEGLDP